MRLRTVLTILSIAAALPCPASAMTVEEAYAAIPHQRPMFNSSIARMGNSEAEYLKQLFEVIDLAVRERVETMAWLVSRGVSGDGVDGYERLLARLFYLQPPARLQLVHRLVTEAIEQQRDVLREWRNGPAMQGRPLPMQHPLVQSSSQKLQQAYDEVLRLFPAEDRRNQQAFFDYFCSLDFL